MSIENIKRRKFVKKMTGLGVLGFASGAGLYFAPDLRANRLILRPPGAVSENRFLELCIKCGQCLQVCPYDSIELEGIKGGAGEGMAFINPSKRGCYLCPAFPCMLACPSGALDHSHDNIKYVAIGMVKSGKGHIPEIREACVGCGACVELCPVEILKVIPRESYNNIYKKGKKNA